MRKKSAYGFFWAFFRRDLGVPSKEECLKELDEILAEGKDVLNRFYRGCGKGDHTRDTPSLTR